MNEDDVDAIAQDLRSYAGAYPIDIFPECDPKKLEKLHKDYPNMAGRIWATCGRKFGDMATKAADVIGWQQAEMERMANEIRRLKQV